MLTLHCRHAGPVPLEAECVAPNRFAPLTLAAIAALPVHHGNTTLQLGDAFAITGDPADAHIVIEGDCSRVKGLGAHMASGRLTINSNVGSLAGSGMTGGVLDVHGDADDYCGAEMRGGLLHVLGNAGDKAGAAYPGSRRGMRGGVLLIAGDAGDDLGAVMRRGTIAVGGRVGAFCAAAAIAGTVVAFGTLGPHVGAGMKRASVVTFGGRPELLPTFDYDCTYRPQFVTLYLRHLRSLGFRVPDDAFAGPFARFRGDALALGKGEGFGVAVLTVDDVTKTYATVRAVAGVSFHVEPGEVFALLGPNGAGKTSLVRMLLGILRPDGGSITYRLDEGKAAWPHPRLLGYLPEDRGLYKDVPILRTLVYFGKLRGMSGPDAKSAALQWLDRMGLAERCHQNLDTFSKGNQQKVQFVSAVLHKPAFAVLDEPFSGLDPLNQDFFARLIRELAAAGTTVLLSAHQMQLIEKLADRILLMNKGKEVLSGTVDEMRAKTHAATRLALRVRGVPDPTLLAGHPAVAGIEAHADGRLVLLLRKGAALGDLLVQVGSQYDVLDVQSERVSLHDIYVHALGDLPLSMEDVA